ncbi:hypothetical protein ACWCOS_15690 [Providencia rettgeri]
MKIQIVSLITILILSIVCSSTLEWRPDNFLISTLYSVCGIMFSIGLGLIVTFNMSGVKNKSYIVIIRDNLKSVRDSFLKYFALSTICLILNQYIQDKAYSIEIKGFLISIYPSLILFLLILYSIVFFIVNFLEVQKLSNDIFDTINKESE